MVEKASTSGLIPSADFSASLETRKKFFAGKPILVTGGTSGIGLETATQLHELGAQIIVGTRSHENFGKVTTILGNERILPFIADLADEKQVEDAIKTLHDQKIQPVAVIHSAAGGMENFLKPVVRKLIRTQRIIDVEEKTIALSELRNEITKNVEESMIEARKINFDGPKRFFEQIVDILPPNSKIIYYSSLWSSIYGQEGADIPEFYKGIASTKNLFEEWMKKNAKEWAAKRIYPAIISGHLVEDSDTGKAISLFLPLASSEDQQLMKNSYIKKVDMTRATLNVLQSDPATWGGFPLRLFVTSEGISKRLSPDNPIFKIHLPV